MRMIIYIINVDYGLNHHFWAALKMFRTVLFEAFQDPKMLDFSKVYSTTFISLSKE